MGIKFNSRTGTIFLDEQTAADTAVAGKGQLWVKNDTPASLVFTDDAGTDVTIASDGALAAPASPSAKLVGIWNYDSTVVIGTSPGANNIAFSNATPTSANRFSIWYVDLDGVDWKQHILDAWGTEFGILVRMTKVGDPLTYMVWSINSDADGTTFNAPYVNLIEWEGTWTNGDDMYVEIQTQPYVARPTVDYGLYYGRASLSGQPLCGAHQTGVMKINTGLNGWNVSHGTGTVTWSQANSTVTVSGADIYRRNASNRHEWYGSANTLPVVTIFEGLVEYGHDNHTGDGAPRLKIHERSTNGGSEAEWGILWVKNDAPNNLYFTDDAGTDYNLTNPGSTATTISTGWSTGSGGGSFTIGANAPLFLEEQAGDDTPAANYGQIWVRSDAPNTLMYTDDAGNDFTANNVLEIEYAYSSAVTSTDPGAGTLNFNSVTIGSITTVYIDDLDNTGRDNSFMLANLADGDVVTFRSASDPADYIVASINGAPTDSTGFWTIGLTLIHTGTIFTNGDKLRLSVEWLSQAAGGGGTISGSITDNQIAVGAATADSIEGSATLTYVSGTTFTHVLSGGTAADFAQWRDSTDTVDLVLRYDGTDFTLRSETAGAGNLYMTFDNASSQVDFGGAITTGGAITATGNINVNDANGPSLQNETASGTNPTLIPNRSDVTTGIGSTGAGGVNIITSGVSRVSTGTVTHLISLNTQIHPGTTGPMLQIGDGDLADQDIMLRLNSDAPYGFLQEGNLTTAQLAFKAFTNDDFVIQNSSGAERFKFDVANGSFSASGGGATSTHYLGIDANNNFNFEVGSNYGIIQLDDDNVSTEAQIMYFDLVSSSTGSREYQFLENGGLHATFDITNNTYTFNGALELIAQTDHGPSWFSGGAMIWPKSRSFGEELLYTTGDNTGIDHPLQNANVHVWYFDATTTAADPGAGDIRFNSATPASVTNLYINDTESTGKDGGYLLSNLADGDIMKLKDVNDAARYLVVSVNGTPTDNTGWWTVPVTVIHAGTLPLGTNPIHIDVEWSGSQAGGTGTVTSVAAGNGLDFTTITTTGSVTMGTPSSITDVSTNSVTTTSHTHAVTALPTGIEVRSAGNTDTENRLLEFNYANGTLRGQIGHPGGATLEVQNRINGGAIGLYAYDVGALKRPIIVGDPDTDTDVTGDVNITLWNAAGVDKVLEGLANSTTTIYYNGVAKLQTQDETAADNSSGVDIVDGSGTMRPAGFNMTPQVTNNATNVPFTQAQVGYDILHDNVTAYTWTTNASTGTAQTDIPAGSMWKCTNLGSGNITIAAGTSVTLYWLDGSGTTGSRTLGQWGTCTVYKYSNTQYHIWGTGLT